MHVHRNEYTVPLVYPNGNTSKQYKISNHGNVYNINGKKLSIYISERPGRGVRRTVCLSEKMVTRKSPSKAGKWSKTYFISKLMWCSFKYVPDKDFEIHHIDGISTNDYLWNLDCVSKIDHIYITMDSNKDKDIVIEKLMIQEMSKKDWTLDKLREKLNLNEKDVRRVYKILNKIDYFNTKYNTKIYPYTFKYDKPLSKEDVYRICDFLCEDTWTYKEIFNNFNVEYTDRYWESKFFYKVRGIYRRKNFTNLTKDLIFGKCIKE